MFFQGSCTEGVNCEERTFKSFTQHLNDLLCLELRPWKEHHMLNLIRAAYTAAWNNLWGQYLFVFLSFCLSFSLCLSLSFVFHSSFFFLSFFLCFLSFIHSFFFFSFTNKISAAQFQAETQNDTFVPLLNDVRNVFLCVSLYFESAKEKNKTKKEQRRNLTSSNRPSRFSQ